ncbi:MAG: LamG domain-containing protein [Phycisphaerae bacterium]
MHGFLAVVVALGASVCDIGAANGQTCITPPPGMVAWWPLDELAGPTAVETVNGNDGTHINGPAPLAGAFVLNSLCFDGATNYVEVPNAPALNFGTGDLSVDAWVQTTTVGGVKVIVEHRKNTPTGVVGYSMYLYQGNLSFQLADGNGSNFCGCLPTRACTNYGPGAVAFVADGAWHHVAVTVNRTSTTGGTFYVDGVAVASFNPTCQPGSITNTGVLRIGSLTLGAGGASLFNGCIDEVELFDRELTALEVSALFTAGPAGKCKTPPPNAKLSKWTQLPHPPNEGFDAPSNLWWDKNPGTGGQTVLADDFVSMCQPGVTCCETCFVTWKGSYVDPNFPVGNIDGFLISFFTDQPATPVAPSRPKDLIVTYFVDQFDEFPSTACPAGCDMHPIFDYNADLRGACIIDNPMGIAGQNQCLPMPPIDTVWWISIEPVLGFVYTKDPANFCVQTKTTNSWPNDFWGWHTTPPQFNFNDDAFTGTLSISPAPKVFTYNWLTDLHWIDVAPTPCLPPNNPNISVNLAFDLHDGFGGPACWDQPACILPPIDPSSNGVDVPTGYQWSGGDVGGPQVNVVVADDFISDGRPITGVRWWGSYPDPAYIPEACCFADGTCQTLTAAQCAGLGGLSQGPGTLCLGDANNNGIDDACEQQQCGPDPLAPIRCLPVTCPVAGEECLPTCVLVETDTGILLEVLDCQCMSPNACHVDILSGPVPTCVGTCPTPGVCISTLVDNGDGTSTLCCQCVTQTQCGPDPATANHTCAPVLCPVAGEDCLPTCVLVDSLTGQLIEVLDCKCMSPNDCHVDITPGVLPTCVGTCPAPSQCTTILTDNGDGTSTLCCQCNPPVECGPDPTTNPPGLTCLPFTCPNAGEECLPVCAVFDPATGITTVLECNCMSPNDCHLVIVQGTVPQCTGACPAGGVCTTTQTVNPDGTITFCCLCVPAPQCGPDPVNPLACAPVACPIAGEQCLPTCVLVETGTGILLQVLNCQCMSPNECHIEINAAGIAGCVGSCPAPGQCVTRLTDNLDGTSTLCCECVPAIVCGPDPTGQACLPVTCPVPGEDCLPICAIFDPATGTTTVTNCQCTSPNACHLVIVPGAPPQCAGGCPNPGDACTTTQTDNADGTITFCCSCGLPGNAPADGSAGGHSHALDATRAVLSTEVPKPRGVPPVGINAVEGWFISFHYGDPAGVVTCPPDALAGVAPTVTGLYFCPASAVTIVDTGVLDCFQERVFRYEVQLEDCCLICTLPDPRRPNVLPAQPDAFHEVRNFDYWLDIQAVVGATFTPVAGTTLCEKVITNSVPSSATANGDFWGWHTSPAVTQPQGPLNEACAGTVLNLPAAPPFCPDYGAWLKQPWLCPPPVVNRVDMAFELLTLCTCLGDMDGNNMLNGLDIQDFIDCLIGTAGPGVNCVCADMDSSGTLDLADVGLFVSALLTMPPCP